MRIVCTNVLVGLVASISLTSILISGADRWHSSGSRYDSAEAGESRTVSQAGQIGPSLIQPSELVSILKSTTDPKPLLIQVGFNVLYVQAHIPGSEFIGPGVNPDAIRKLHNRVESLPRTQPIVLYCGCCPWNECPNIKPALRELDSMGFNNVRLLYIAHNFGEDWVAKNYPVAKGR